MDEKGFRNWGFSKAALQVGCLDGSCSEHITDYMKPTSGYIVIARQGIPGPAGPGYGRYDLVLSFVGFGRPPAFPYGFAVEADR